MNFDWTNDETTLKERLGILLKEPAFQNLEALEEEDLDGLRRRMKELLPLLGERGYLSVDAPGERAGNIMNLLAAQEELARASGSLFLSAEVTARLFGNLIAEHGQGALGAEILEPLKAGALIGAMALTEPSEREDEAGDAPGLGNQTIARRQSDGFILKGKKNFVTNAPIADWLLVSAALEEGMALFLIPSGAPGLELGPRMKTPGFQGLAVSSLSLEDVKVAPSHMIGPFDDETALQEMRKLEALILALAGVGLMARTVETTKDHAKAHRRGGKPIFAHQEVRFKLAEMLTLYQTAQLMTYRATWLHSKGNPEAAGLILSAKVFASEAAERVSNLAMQVMAGEAYLWGNPVERAYREAKYMALAGTTSEHARMAIADELLEKYRG